MTDLRIGIGYDIHRLVPGRRLMMGGIEIEFDRGLAGHSDGDVLLHAICDAVLGAAGAGDIGRLFPDTDARFANISSLELLRQVGQRTAGDGFRVLSIDSIVVAERPKLAPHAGRMCAAIAEALDVDVERVSVKAKTAEGLGEIGRGEAMAAQAVALLTRS